MSSCGAECVQIWYVRGGRKSDGNNIQPRPTTPRLEASGKGAYAREVLLDEK
jgi:hypothetical protein